MKAALGKNVKIGLPKAFQISKEQTESLAVKGVATDITDNEFKEFLDLNKISYAKAERLKSKKDGRVLPLFRIEINDPVESRGTHFPKSSLPNNRRCIQGGRISIRQYFNCQSFGYSAKNYGSKQKCLICGENHSHKGCPKKEARKPKCANCKGS